MGEFDDDGQSEIAIPRYELSDEELQVLTADLLSQRVAPEGLSPADRFVTVEVDAKSKFANLARHVERVVFEQKFGNDAEEMTKEYGPYEKASRFFISIDRTTGLPIGAQRVIEHSAAGFKTLKDAAEPPFNVSEEDVMTQHSIADPTKLWDIGTVAVLSEYRGPDGPVSTQSFRAMYLSAVKHGIDHFVSMIDDKLKKQLVEMLGLPFTPIVSGSQPGEYLGSGVTHALYAYVPELHQKSSERRQEIAGTSMERFIADTFKRLLDKDQDRLIFPQP